MEIGNILKGYASTISFTKIIPEICRKQEAISSEALRLIDGVYQIKSYLQELFDSIKNLYCKMMSRIIMRKHIFSEI